MEEDGAAATGPEFGPPIGITSYERVLDPLSHFTEEFLDWWFQVYRVHMRHETEHGLHHAGIFCRFCDAIREFRSEWPERHVSLLNYLAARYKHEKD